MIYGSPPSEPKPPKAEVGGGKPPGERTVRGPGAYTLGIIAAQPGSNWQSRALEIEQRRAVESSKGDLQALKLDHREKVLNEFDKITSKKNVVARIRERVEHAMKAVDVNVECRRTRLRNMLLSEESALLKEYIHKAHEENSNRLDEMKQKSDELKLKKQAEDSEIAAQKRIQQYKNRCEELRTFRVDLNKKEVTEAVLKQIEENKIKHEVEKELENMWYKVSMKNYALMVAYEEQEKRKQLEEQRLIEETLQNQILGKKILEDERIQIHHEEQEMVEKLREELRIEEEKIMQEKAKTQEKIFNEMEEYKKKCAEIKGEKVLQENMLNQAFCDLINEELEKEKGLVQDNKAELRKKNELFRAELKKRERERQLKEEEEEILRTEVMAKAEAEKEALRLRMKQAREKLQNDVLMERQKQIIEKKKKLEAEKKKHDDEIKLADILRTQNIELDKEQEKKLQLERQEYRKELKQQIEYNRQKMLKQCEDEEHDLKEQLMKEEQYLAKAKQYFTKDCSPSTHPFMKKLQGQAI